MSNLMGPPPLPTPPPIVSVPPPNPLMGPPPPKPPMPPPVEPQFDQSVAKRTRGGVPINVAARAQSIYRQEAKAEAQKESQPIHEGLKKEKGWGGGQ